MKRIFIFVTILSLSLSACSTHFHLDFLGKEEIQEVVLIDSPAKNKILLLDLTGIIATTFNPGLLEREGDILSRIHYRLRKARTDRQVKGVLLRLDTPGGEVTASDILYNEVLRFRQETGIPVVALMMGLTASGGYYVASACDAIIAHPSTITGSIGVISIFPNLEELFTKIGIRVHVIKSGKLKDSGSAFREMTEEERSVFQGIVDELYQEFLDVVLQGRKDALTREELAGIADGRVYTAAQALELKLIDQIGYFDTALDRVLSLAAISGAKVIAYSYYPKSKTNIYASTLQKSSLWESRDWTDLAHSLKSGFYYLWLPPLYD